MKALLSRAIVAAFLCGIGWWGWRAGLDVRDRAWACSPSIRYSEDIGNAIHWGNRVLRTAEALADHVEPPASDSTVAARDPARLTLGQIVRGEGRVYADLMNDHRGGDFELDYPPLRLLTMSLWARAVQQRVPGLNRWPGDHRPRAGQPPNAGDRRVALATEDVAGPVLWFNTCCEAATAVLAFALVWLWVDRGGRRGRPLAGPVLGRAVRRPARGPATPWRRAHGLLLFPVSASAFAYAASVAVLPSPAPPPAVMVTGPAVVYAVGPNVEARVSASVDPQAAQTRWHAEWGRSAGAYDHATPDQDAGAGSGATDVSTVLTGLPAGATVHYRLVARNDGHAPANATTIGRGTTTSDDATLIATAGVVQPPPPTGTNGAAWLNRWQWLGVGLLFALTCAGLRVLPPEHRGWAAGLLAATFVWFDPGLLVDAHVWPQWDVWVLPPFLLAALLASLDWWLAAGLVMGVGAMFKGQFLIGSPVLILWPLLSLRFGAVARLLSGFALMAGLIVSPWLVLNEQVPSLASAPVQWIVAVGVAATVAAALSLYRTPVARSLPALWVEARASFRRRGGFTRHRWPLKRSPQLDPGESDSGAASDPATPTVSRVAVGLFALAALAAIVTDTLLVVCRWPADAELPRSWAAVLLLAVLVPPWVLRRRSLVVWATAVAAAALWGSAWLFHGDWSWKVVGFDYGTRKYEHLAINGGSGSNLGTILATQFGWQTHDPMLTFHPPDLAGLLRAGRPAPPPQWMRDWSLDGSAVTLDVRQSMMALFAVAVLLAGVGAAIHDRRSDPRFLAALVAPWMLMPCLLAQMMNRYTLWGAVLSSMLVGISSGLGLVHVVFTVLSAGMVGLQLLGFDPSRSPRVAQLVGGLAPNDAGILLACAAVVLFVGVVPGRRAPHRRQVRGRPVRSNATSTSVAVPDTPTTRLADAPAAAVPLDDAENGGAEKTALLL